MNPIQRGIAVCAIALIAASTAFAPYEFTAHNEIARLVNGDRRGAPVRGITYAPLWKPPESSNGLTAPAYAFNMVGAGAEVDDVRFAPGRLAIEWLGLAIVAAVAIALAGRTGGEKSATAESKRPRIGAFPR